jgi:hypothetical protein
MIHSFMIFPRDPDNWGVFSSRPSHFKQTLTVASHGATIRQLLPLG